MIATGPGMSDDLVKRLRDGGNDFCADGPCWPGDVMLEAADLIEALEADEEALKADLDSYMKIAHEEMRRADAREAALKTARREALEEAARVAEAVLLSDGRGTSAYMVVAAIRALKGEKE